jgi:hypothetical protein
MVGQSLLVPFWRLKKGLAVRAKPPAAMTAATDMYSIPLDNQTLPPHLSAQKFSHQLKNFHKNP